METYSTVKKRILLVDDESSIRRSISLGLCQEGYDVEPCETALKALKKLDIYEKNNIYFDQVVLDIKLPDINGIKLGKIIKAKYPDTSIVFISGYAENFDSEDLKNMSSTTFLEKPFTTNDLTYQFDELSKITQTSTFEAPKENEEITGSVSSYALLKLKSDTDFFETYRKLYFMKDVLYCDATKGDYDIFLLIQGAAKEANSKTLYNIKKNIKGIEKIDFLEIEKPLLDNDVIEIINSVENISNQSVIPENNRDLSKNISSYILLEAEREKMDTIYPTLRLDEQVVYCDYVTGKYNLVLLVQGRQFSDIDKFIENKISNIDGILKVKKYSIINLFDM